ncbi:ANTAR domain-containing protein [Kutzneria sp. CA-103260]|uniref:ANTAR domain-containing protein n=1 Tax=Kutzneria sp. CA-103260 TaxID=2802641 RepID=UPI001BAC4ED1|nr:ANTAR domain-containing protein [Kutzneria sp. CA-103260]QUQ68578.1 ANTAR domain-containing protein [Kutzneria sp. CA-103260]
MSANGEDTAGSALPTPDRVEEFLADLGRAVRAGRGLCAVPTDTTRLFGMDALTVSVVHGGLPELVWCDPAEGLGPALEELQYTLGEGPTLEAGRQGHAVIEPDLAATDPVRWPAFLPAAAQTPARAVIADPLQLGIITVGVLTGYRTSPRDSTTAQRRDIRRLGRVLLLLLLVDSTGTGPADATGPPTDLFLHRAEIHQATGFLATSLGIPLDEALLRLRAHAAAQDQSLTDLAHALLTHRLPPDALIRQ